MVMPPREAPRSCISVLLKLKQRVKQVVKALPSLPRILSVETSALLGQSPTSAKRQLGQCGKKTPTNHQHQFAELVFNLEGI